MPVCMKNNEPTYITHMQRWDVQSCVLEREQKPARLVVG